MNSLVAVRVPSNPYLNGLPSKINFDTVEENKKPSATTEGLRRKNSDFVESDYGTQANTILSESPNLFKQNGTVMSKKSSSRFIKLNQNETTEWLMAKHPVAYLLLNLVAYRSTKNNRSPTGLGIGEALIGDYDAIGTTRQKYRTALKLLVSRKFFKILENCRTRQKSTTGITTIGTKVKLLDSEVWDINYEFDNHHINHRPTTDQPPSNHEQEEIDMKEIEIEDAHARDLKKDGGGEFKKNQSKLDESEIYRAMLKFDFPTEIVKEAIERAKNMKGEIFSYVHYVEKTCKNLIQNQNRKKSSDQKTTKKQTTESSSAPPRAVGEPVFFDDVFRRLNGAK